MKDTHVDEKWYLDQYPDVSKSKMSASEHFHKYGKLLGRYPNSSEKKSGVGSSLNESKKYLENSASNIRNKKASYEFPFAEDFSRASFDEFDGMKELPGGDVEGVPLVSFIMTAYNAELTVGRSVSSLLNQTYPNIEIVICDDKSGDGTWEVLKELRKKSPNVIKIVRMETNSGTYIAKNIAVAESSGEILLFQDSDDYSHPDRALVQALPLLKDSNLVATRTKYCRFGKESGRIIPVAGLNSKYGLITLAVRKEAFEQIGYFDAVRKAGDDEWFQRLQHLYGKKRIIGLDVTLYLAELREGSLVADMLTFNDDGTVEQSSSKERKDYVKIFKGRFSDKKKRRQWYRDSFPVVPKCPGGNYPPSIAAIKTLKEPVFAALCSIPSRQKQLEMVVRRILPQVDRLYIYLDKYKEVPGFIRGLDKVFIYRSEDFDVDFRDNAKFLPYKDLEKEFSGFYYVTLDDDIVYPYDYVRTLTRKIDEYSRSAVVGLHGVVCTESPRKYFRQRFIYHFNNDELKAPALVNNLGTGTVAFHSTSVRNIDPRDWPQGGLVDIFFSMEARKQNTPLVCIERKSGWIKEADMPEDNSTLFKEFNNKEKIVVNALQRMLPWGYRAIFETVERQDPELKEMYRELLPMFPQRISVASTFHRLRGS